MYEYTPEDPLRLALLAAISKHGFHWGEYSLTDDPKKESRTVKVQASRPNGDGFVSGDALRTAVLDVLEEHGLDLAVYQLGDTTGAANLVVTGRRDLNGQQARLPGT